MSRLLSLSILMLCLVSGRLVGQPRAGYYAEQGRHQTYLRMGKKTDVFHEVFRQTNSRIFSPLHRDLELYMMEYPSIHRTLNNHKILDRILYKHLSPYYQQVYKSEDLDPEIAKNSFNSYSVVIDLDGRPLEVSFMHTSPKKGAYIPTQVFERIEAEFMQSGLQARMYSHKPRMIACKTDWLPIHRDRYGLSFYKYNKSFEAAHYEGLSVDMRDEDFSWEQRSMVYRMLRYGYEELWDKATFPFFTPEIMTRISIGKGWFYAPSKSQPDGRWIDKAVRGDASVFLPYEQASWRANDSTIKPDMFRVQFERRRFNTYESYSYREPPSERNDFTLEELAHRLASAFAQIAMYYELYVESYFDTKLRETLDKADWFRGGFGETFDCYARFKGIAPLDLAHRYLQEMQAFIGAGLKPNPLPPDIKTRLAQDFEGSAIYPMLRDLYIPPSLEDIPSPPCSPKGTAQ